MKTARAGSRRNFNWKMKVFAGMLNVLSSRSATAYSPRNAVKTRISARWEAFRNI